MHELPSCTRDANCSTRAAGARAAALATCLLLLSAFAPVANASTGHVLDPTLSLIGGPGTSAIDPVPDPGSQHPEKPFNDPCGVATDAYGDIYVANGASSTSHSVGEETQFEGRIDIFDASGEFITELSNVHWPCSLAVSSSGQVFVQQFWTNNVVRYDPTLYEPAVGKITYAQTPIEITGGAGAGGLALNPSNEDLYLTKGGGLGSWIEDWTKEQEEGNEEKNRFGMGEVPEATGVDVWGQNGDIHASGTAPQQPRVARVFTVDGGTRQVKTTLSGTPSESFGFEFGRAAVAVDQENGDFYVGDLTLHHAVDQFDAEDHFIGQLKLAGNGLKESEPFSDIAVDEGAHSPNRGYVYVTSGFLESNSHLYAFAPLVLDPPEIRNEHVEEVGEGEALLAAELNPHGASTSFHFEYGTSDCTAGTCQSAPSTPLDAGSGSGFEPVSVPLVGLAAGSSYHYRLIATSNCNPAEPNEECVIKGPDAVFATFPARPQEACPNDGLRVGPSARLPDCRAYELVTPPDTNGRVPTATLFGEGAVTSPPVPLASATGESLLFATEGGALPGIGGGGFHDAYVANRGPGGWEAKFTGLDAEQAQEPFPTGTSADHAYSFWRAAGTKGRLTNAENPIIGAYYLRAPNGATEPVGIGSGGVDLAARGRWLSPGATHVIFTAKATRLVPEAPPAGTEAVYDRSPGAPTQVISLLPGNLTPEPGENAEYLGASSDGSAVAFRIAGTIYERIGDSETLEVTKGPATTFAGISANGAQVFYVKGGDVFDFDAGAKTTVMVGEGGKSTVVNISASGDAVYFVSPLVLTPGEANSHGAEPALEAENLYAWDGGTGAIHYVATLEEIDVAGEPPPVGGLERPIGGLGLWTTDAVAPEQDQFIGPANDPSRTDPGGDVLAFESRAKLTDYDSEGHTEIYRYDAAESTLSCVSCPPIGTGPTSNARLESRYAPLLHSVPPVNAISQIANVTANGNRIFFETDDALSTEDTNGKSDVYEWEAQGNGSCGAASGCTFLISSGHGAAPNYLYGVNGDGRDVFFWSGDVLSGWDQSGSPSIYDARVDGGFEQPPASAGACQEEACQGAPAPSPALASPVSFPFPGPSKKHHKRHHQTNKHHKRSKAKHHGKSKGHR